MKRPDQYSEGWAVVMMRGFVAVTTGLGALDAMVEKVPVVTVDELLMLRDGTEFLENLRSLPEKLVRDDLDRDAVILERTARVRDFGRRFFSA